MAAEVYYAFYLYGLDPEHLPKVIPDVYLTIPVTKGYIRALHHDGSVGFNWNGKPANNYVYIAIGEHGAIYYNRPSMGLPLSSLPDNPLYIYTVSGDIGIDDAPLPSRVLYNPVIESMEKTTLREFGLRKMKQ